MCVCVRGRGEVVTVFMTLTSHWSEDFGGGCMRDEREPSEVVLSDLRYKTQANHH